MFFIMGINSGEKELDYDQVEICKCCGGYGHIKVFMTYTYFMFFFIPIFKWNKRYFVRMSCCGSSCEINPELGKAIARGEISHVSMDSLNFGGRAGNVKRCGYCGYTTTDDFAYCPKCGRQL